MLFIRCIFVAYWLLLTTLLLVPEPLKLLRVRRIPWDLSDIAIHAVVFAVLGLFTWASRLPFRRLILVGLLIGYATATELLQSHVGRDTALPDFLANLLGLTAGTAIWFGAQRYLFAKRNKPEWGGMKKEDRTDSAGSAGG